MPATSFFVRDPQHTQRSCCTLAQAGATGTGDDSLFLSRCRGRGSQNRAVATATSPDNNPCRSRKYCARKRITLLLFFLAVVLPSLGCRLKKSPTMRFQVAGRDNRSRLPGGCAPPQQR